MTDQELIGQRIALARKLCKVRQVDLGAAIGVSDQTISNWEVGMRTPRADLLRKLCIELGCNSNFILGLSEEHGISKERLYGPPAGQRE